MNYVEFEGDKFDYSVSGAQSHSNMVQKLINRGYFKDKKTAQIFLLTVSIFLFATAVFIYYIFTPKPVYKNDIKILPQESVGYPQDKLFRNNQ